MAERKYTTVEEYFADLSPDQRPAMDELRSTIRSALPPEAIEGISYQIPTFKLNGRAVVWYAAFRDHLSLYPWSDAMRDELGAELKPYLSGKGTIRFELGAPLPVELVKRIVRFRLQETSTGYR